MVSPALDQLGNKLLLNWFLLPHLRWQDIDLGIPARLADGARQGSTEPPAHGHGAGR